jgi:hypothetical protein
METTLDAHDGTELEVRKGSYIKQLIRRRISPPLLQTLPLHTWAAPKAAPRTAPRAAPQDFSMPNCFRWILNLQLEITTAD